MEGNPDAPSRINEDNQPEHPQPTAGANGGHDSAAYKRASAALQQLPDLGETYMRRARDALGERPLRELVIHAAQLASLVDDERQTSA